MKNITLSADEELIERAKAVARARGTTLDHEFRDWLRDFADSADGRSRAERALEVIRELQKHVDTGGRRFTREELNARR